jgi:hypothetical protein
VEEAAWARTCQEPIKESGDSKQTGQRSNPVRKSEEAAAVLHFLTSTRNGNRSARCSNAGKPRSGIDSGFSKFCQRPGMRKQDGAWESLRKKAL